MEKVRDYYFDNLKALLIVLVVVGHMIEPLIGNYSYKALYCFIYAFHMPLFLFVSGYFSKNTKSEGLKKILITYIVFQTLYALFSTYILKENHSFSYFYPYWIMWYLFALFFMQLTLPAISGFKYSVIASFIVGVAIGYDNNASYFFSLSRILVFYPYFLLGYYFDKSMFLNIKNKKVISVGLLVLTAIVFYYFSSHIDVRLFHSSYPYKALSLNLSFAWVYRLVIYLIAIVLGVLVLNLIPDNKNAFSNMGKNTLSIYLLHGFIVKLLVKFGLINMILAIPVALIISCVLSLEVFNKLVSLKINKARN